ncbi:hypothetical protein IE53DRAFT_234857 [Violaceomyces palustris]|uniref:Uncharacterized protein n=1 Tax=Violaceomyces palustris TaxID=1673888 RepID=A0ACD0P494_9BASI|nr:hypothetical protein IE53DRAFT_234857 [Violaceomyces palustris]
MSSMLKSYDHLLMLSEVSKTGTPSSSWRTLSRLPFPRILSVLPEGDLKVVSSDGKEYKVHSKVLAVKSGFFRNMFEIGAKRRGSNPAFEASGDGIKGPLLGSGGSGAEMEIKEAESPLSWHSDEAQTIRMPEGSDYLESFLSVFYPGSEKLPRICMLEDFKNLLNISEKYDSREALHYFSDMLLDYINTTLRSSHDPTVRHEVERTERGTNQEMLVELYILGKSFNLPRLYSFAMREAVCRDRPLALTEDQALRMGVRALYEIQNAVLKDSERRLEETLRATRCLCGRSFSEMVRIYSTLNENQRRALETRSRMGSFGRNTVAPLLQT